MKTKREVKNEQFRDNLKKLVEYMWKSERNIDREKCKKDDKLKYERDRKKTYEEELREIYNLLEETKIFEHLSDNRIQSLIVLVVNMGVDNFVGTNLYKELNNPRKLKMEELMKNITREYSEEIELIVDKKPYILEENLVKMNEIKITKSELSKFNDIKDKDRKKVKNSNINNKECQNSDLSQINVAIGLCKNDNSNLMR